MLPLDNDIRDQILHADGNVVVSASAGTGKTYTTVKRITIDVNKISNYQTFAAITFTRKAAKEILERIGVNKSEGVIGTNDNFVLKEIIQPFMYDAYGSQFKIEIKQNFTNQDAIRSFEEGVKKIRETGFICKYRDIRKNFSFQLALDILRKSRSAQRYFKSKYFRLYIDEYQDCDVDMHNLFMFICKTLKVPLFVVGDTKQSIYGWRGAYSDGFTSLIGDEDFKDFKLWHNFRSNKVIQNYSNIFMDDVRENYQEVNFNEEVQAYRYQNEEDALNYIINWLDQDLRCSFLNFRRNDAEKWSNLLEKKGINFIYIPTSPLDFSELESEHVWISRIVACYLLEERYNEYDVFEEIPMPESFEFQKVRKILKLIGENKTEFDDFNEACLELYQYLGYSSNDKIHKEIDVLFKVVNEDKYRYYYNASKYKLTSSTIHSSKGLEYEQVIIVGNDFDLTNDNDRYLHYVAVSRPKEKLLVLIHDSNRGIQYYEELNTVVQKTKELGIDVKVSDVIRKRRHSSCSRLNLQSIQ